ncbi:PspA-associated protein PspAB [Streptomyces sp. NPDC004838]
MGLLDTILGRSKPVRPDLDQLFALPSAAITLQAGAGLTPTGTGSVCFASVEGGAFARIQQDVRDLLDADAGRGGVPVEFSRDAYGYTWLLVRQPADDTASLVNDLHAVNTLLEDGGFGPQLLCSLIAFREAAGETGGRPLALVYLYKRGTFYPFAPIPGAVERRDNALELQARALLTDDLRVEKDLARWFPVWGAPGLSG